MTLPPLLRRFKVKHAKKRRVNPQPVDSLILQIEKEVVG